LRDTPTSSCASLSSSCSWAALSTCACSRSTSPHCASSSCSNAVTSWLACCTWLADSSELFSARARSARRASWSCWEASWSLSISLCLLARSCSMAATCSSACETRSSAASSSAFRPATASDWLVSADIASSDLAASSILTPPSSSSRSDISFLKASTSSRADSADLRDTPTSSCASLSSSCSWAALSTCACSRSTSPHCASSSCSNAVTSWLACCTWLADSSELFSARARSARRASWSCWEASWSVSISFCLLVRSCSMAAICSAACDARSSAAWSSA